MIPVCLYFQVHQPYRLRRYNYFDVGREHRYFDEAGEPGRSCGESSRTLLPAGDRDARAAARAPPALRRLLLDLGLPARAARALGARTRSTRSGGWRPTRTAASSSSPRPRITRSRGSPRRRSSPPRSTSTGAPSRTSSAGTPRGLPQHRAHLLRRAGRVAGGAGLPGVLADGVEPLLGPRSPHHVYRAATPKGLPLLLRDYRLSDDIAFRFSNRSWDEWPLTAEKYDRWISRLRGRSAVALHGLRDLRRAPVEGDRASSSSSRPGSAGTCREARRGVPDALAGDRRAGPTATCFRRPGRSRGPTRPGTSRPGRATTCSRTP